MGKSEFLHVGLTVSDIATTVSYYKKYFEFESEMEGVFPPEFIVPLTVWR